MVQENNKVRFFEARKLFRTGWYMLIAVGLSFITLGTSALLAQTLEEAAKNEGKLMFYSSMVVPDTQAMGAAFMKKYPFIKFDFVRLGDTNLLQRLLSEKRSNKKIASVFFLQLYLANVYKSEGLMQKYISPEARGLPEGFQDPEGYWTTVYSIYHTFVYNTRMVTEKEAPKRYEDLLDPRWKGKIGMSNNEYTWFKGMLDSMGREQGLQYMRRLAKQDIIFRKGRTLTTQLMVAGEFPIAKGVYNRVLSMQEEGAPIHWASFPTPTMADMRAFVLHADAPQPNAGKLFIDFMLSREGQGVLNKLDRHPVRRDIKVDSVIDKVRNNLFPVKPASAEGTVANIEEFKKVFQLR